MARDHFVYSRIQQDKDASYVWDSHSIWFSIVYYLPIHEINLRAHLTRSIKPEEPNIL